MLSVDFQKALYITLPSESALHFGATKMTYVLDNNYFLITAIVTVIYQASFFAVAFGFKFDKVTDFAGGTNFIVLALLTFFLGNSWHARQIILTALQVAWGVRLSGFLFMRILKWGEDHRFDQMRSNFFQFAGFWVFQAFWVWTVSLPVTIVNATTHRNPSIEARDVIGWVMWAVGLAFEAAADQQKLAFKNDSANRGKWCDVGVWKYSRHPNYFGEILLWWGMFTAGAPVFKGVQWIAVLGPIFTMSILLFLSGIPMLEQSADKKFGSRQDYLDYKQRTSPLIPIPPVLYKAIPRSLKAIFLLELPFYDYTSASNSKNTSVVDV